MINIGTGQAQRTADNICRAIEAIKTVILPQYEGMDETSNLKLATLSWNVASGGGYITLVVYFDKDSYRATINGTEYGLCNNLAGLKNCLVNGLRNLT